MAAEPAEAEGEADVTWDHGGARLMKAGKEGGAGRQARQDETRQDRGLVYMLRGRANSTATNYGGREGDRDRAGRAVGCGDAWQRRAPSQSQRTAENERHGQGACARVHGKLGMQKPWEAAGATEGGAVQGLGQGCHRRCGARTVSQTWCTDRVVDKDQQAFAVVCQVGKPLRMPRRRRKGTVRGGVGCAHGSRSITKPCQGAGEGAGQPRHDTQAALWNARQRWPGASDGAR